LHTSKVPEISPVLLNKHIDVYGMRNKCAGVIIMTNREPADSKKSFINGFLQETVQLAAEFKKSIVEAKHLAEQAIAFEDLPITSTYPRELFEEDAKKLGINIDELGEKEAIKQIVMLQFEQEKMKALSKGEEPID
jgi:hypothetical protein